MIIKLRSIINKLVCAIIGHSMTSYYKGNKVQCMRCKRVVGTQSTVVIDYQMEYLGSWEQPSQSHDNTRVSV